MSQLPAHDETLPPAERKRLGAWYTPSSLVEHVVEQTIGTVEAGSRVRVLDPACGDGRFLFAAARWIRSHGGVPLLTGVDIDPRGLRASGPAGEPIELIEADALSFDWGSRSFDVVLGNPPFLSQMSSATVRAGGSRFGGGPYADAAADFLALSIRLARSVTGRVGLVLPLSLLTARDAGPIRAEIDRTASMTWFWWSEVPVFDATVRTCAIGLRRTESPRVSPRMPIVRTVGHDFRPTTSAAGADARTVNDHWGRLIADGIGVPRVPPIETSGALTDRALVTANFRDQYYGLIGAVSDRGVGPPLITTGLIDVATCNWGARPTRFAKQRFDAPRVDRTNLVPFMQRWFDRCLVPKVLVATQTRVLEAVADETGEWLPAVPVVRLIPHEHADLWKIAALLTSPVASAVIAHQSVGSGLSLQTMRVSQRTLGALSWPSGDLTSAVAALRDRDILECGRAVDAAYGVDDEQLLSWWSARAVT